MTDYFRARRDVDARSSEVIDRFYTSDYGTVFAVPEEGDGEEVVLIRCAEEAAEVITLSRRKITASIPGEPGITSYRRMTHGRSLGLKSVVPSAKAQGNSKEMIAKFARAKVGQRSGPNNVFSTINAPRLMCGSTRPCGRCRLLTSVVTGETKCSQGVGRGFIIPQS